jgi:hypothetical protein
MNLSDDKIVDNIINIIQTNKQHLTYLDLSWSSLTPIQLAKISDEFKHNPYIVKNLNLSYNVLNFDSEKPFYAESMLFVSNMVEYIKLTGVLNHLSL